MNSKTKGNLGEIAVAHEFIKWGCTVSFPFGDNARYDLIVDDGQNLKRVQIKYTDCKSENNSWACRCESSKNHTTNKRMDKYIGDVDLMVFYIAELQTCIMFTMDEIGQRTTINVREEYPNNGQRKGIILIKDHTFNNYFKSTQLETVDVEAGEFDETPKKDNDELNSQVCDKCVETMYLQPKSRG